MRFQIWILSSKTKQRTPQLSIWPSQDPRADSVPAWGGRARPPVTSALGPSGSVSFCTFLAHEYPDLVHKVIMINGGGPTALEPSICSIFNMPACVLHCLSPCLAWSFLK